MPNSPTAAQVAEILAFEAGQQTPAGTILFAAASTGDRAVQTAAAAAYDMAGWTTVANERARRAEKRRAATLRTCPTGCCTDGLVTSPTPDGPELSACTSTCCREATR